MFYEQNTLKHTFYGTVLFQARVFVGEGGGRMWGRREVISQQLLLPSFCHIWSVMNSVSYGLKVVRYL